MGQEPVRRQITTTVGSPIRLRMNFEEIEASEVQLLINGDVVKTRDVSPDRSGIGVTLTPNNSGEDCIEMVAEGSFPEEMEHLKQQDALEFSPPKAHVVWDVTVEPAQQSEIGQVWRIVANLLVLREVVSIVRNREEWVRDRLGRSDSGDETEDEVEDGVNMSLDEFQGDSDERRD